VDRGGRRGADRRDVLSHQPFDLFCQFVIRPRKAVEKLAAVRISTAGRRNLKDRGPQVVEDPAMPVIRISKGKFDPKHAAEAEQRLRESERALRQTLSQLAGLLHYYVGIDRERGFLTNVSVWDSLEHAQQMDTLQAMLAQRPILEAAGVEFEVITNHETLWTI
jgi:hypothetical protein